MGKKRLTRTSLLLDAEKVRRLRKAFRSRSNSEAVRLIIDERLAVEMGLQALRNLRKIGEQKTFFNRTPQKKK